MNLKLIFEFRVDEVGLCLMSDYPFLGASPDGIVSYACCGKGTLEIKVFLFCLTVRKVCWLRETMNTMHRCKCIC